MLGIAVEGVHHATPVLIYLGRHALVVVPATVAGLHAVARVRADLRPGGQDRARALLKHLAFLVGRFGSRGLSTRCVRVQPSNERAVGTL